MALNYQQFLNKSWGAGAKSNATRAAAWRRTQPAAATATTPAPPAAPTQPSFTPGSLDESGSRNLGQLRFNYQAGQNAENMDYSQRIGELDAQRPQLDHSRDLGYQSADNSAAGRGLFHSGIRQEARTEVGANYDQGVRDLERQRLAAANRHQLALDTSQGQYGIDTSNNMIDSNERQRRALGLA